MRVSLTSSLTKAGRLSLSFKDGSATFDLHLWPLPNSPRFPFFA